MRVASRRSRTTWSSLTESFTEGRHCRKNQVAKKIELVRTSSFLIYLSSQFPCRVAAPCPRPVLRVGSSNYDGHKVLNWTIIDITPTVYLISSKGPPPDQLDLL